MSESIWTRQRRLKDHEAGVLTTLRICFKGLQAELAEDDWIAAENTAHVILVASVRMQEIERELEDVDALVMGMTRIQQGMELLEGQK